MIDEVWRVVLLIEKGQSKLITPAVINLYRLGLDQIHVIAPSSVRIPQSYDLIAHQASTDQWSSSYRMFREGLEIISQVYGSRSELFLVLRPTTLLWSQLPVYCEQTIPREIVAIFSPLTPTRCFPTSRRMRPKCDGDFGWCPAEVNRDMSHSHCFVCTGHMLTLMSAYLPATEQSAEISSMLSEHLGRRRGVPFYFHSPSLATSREHDYAAEDFVGVAHSMSQKIMRSRSFMLQAI